MGFLRSGDGGAAAVAAAAAAASRPSDDAHAPLLPSGCDHAAAPTAAAPPASPPLARGRRRRPLPPADLGPRFAARLWRLLVAVDAPAPALLLAAAAVLEALVVSRVGTVSSSYYEAFVDGDAARLPALLLWSCGLYAASALFFAAKAALQELLAWRWRARLAARLQRAYFGGGGAATLADAAGAAVDNPDQRVAQDLPLLTACLADTLAVLAAAPFNVVWYTLLTRQVFGSWAPVAAAYGFFALGALLQQLAMAPVASATFALEAAEGGYRYHHMRLRAWAADIDLSRAAPVELGALELRLGAVLACQGRLVLRRAALMAATKCLEYGGLVVNFCCLAAAVFGGAWDAERASAGGIAAKVSVASFYLLTLIYSFTQVLDLAGKVSSLAALTARVSQLMEALEGAGEQQQQQRPQPHERRGKAWREQAPGKAHRAPFPPLPAPQQQQQQQQAGAVAQPAAAFAEDEQRRRRSLQLLGDGTTQPHRRYASQAMLLQAPEIVLVGGAAGATGSSSGRGSGGGSAAGSGQEALLEVSVHSLGNDVLQQEVRRVFPDCPRLAPLTAVVTFQFCGSSEQLMRLRLEQQQEQRRRQLQQVPPGGDRRRSGAAASAEEERACAGGGGACRKGGGVCSVEAMGPMLEVFLSWQQAVCSHVSARGYWADAVHPCTGCALRGGPGAAYDEVFGAQVLLGYSRSHEGPGRHPMISHPVAGTQVYPATLFTSAPLPVLRDALRAAAAQPGCPDSIGGASGALGGAGGGGAGAALQGGSCPGSVCGGPDHQPSAPSQQQQQRQPQLPAAAATAPLRTLSLLLPPPPPLLECCRLSVSTPLGAPVVCDLSLSLSAADGGLAIQGPSGCGKSTLLRCLAGIWAADAGRCTVPGPLPAPGVPGGAMFLPQRPLAAPGATLRDQLAYPAPAAAFACRGSGAAAGHCEAAAAAAGAGEVRARWAARWRGWLACGMPTHAGPSQPRCGGAGGRQQQRHLPRECASCARMLAALREAGLGYLLASLPMGLAAARPDWGASLSPGEMQRLALARVLLHRPALAVLDEATSSLPDADAAGLYQRLRDAGVCCVSVCHSGALLQLHGRVLAIAGDGAGGWRLEASGGAVT